MSKQSVITPDGTAVTLIEQLKNIGVTFPEEKIDLAGGIILAHFMVIRNQAANLASGKARQFEALGANDQWRAAHQIAELIRGMPIVSGKKPNEKDI